MIANTGNLMLDGQLPRGYPLKDYPVQFARSH